MRHRMNEKENRKKGRKEGRMATVVRERTDV
jgi:hypothetical protein